MIFMFVFVFVVKVEEMDDRTLTKKSRKMKKKKGQQKFSFFLLQKFWEWKNFQVSQLIILHNYAAGKWFLHQKLFRFMSLIEVKLIFLPVSSLWRKKSNFKSSYELSFAAAVAINLDLLMHLIFCCSTTMTNATNMSSSSHSLFLIRLWIQFAIQVRIISSINLYLRWAEKKREKMKWKFPALLTSRLFDNPREFSTTTLCSTP